MIDGIIETEDRWIFPLRGSVVVRVDWGPKVTFELDPPGRIIAGQEAIFGHGPTRMVVADPVTLREQGIEKAQQTVGGRVLVSVGFKSGGMRIVFQNGWTLIVDSDGEFVPASIESGDSTIWERPFVRSR
jgi:hypothetical protein